MTRCAGNRPDRRGRRPAVGSGSLSSDMGATRERS
jgi:hypothetical protein